jgi:hypothetical protein
LKKLVLFRLGVVFVNDASWGSSIRQKDKSCNPLVIRGTRRFYAGRLYKPSHADVVFNT